LDGVITCGECGATLEHDANKAELECSNCDKITLVAPKVFSMPVQELSQVDKDANAISSIVNNFNFRPGSVAKILMKDHRTIQQNIARFCVVYLEELAKKDLARDTDPRNEDCVKLAKKFVECVPEQSRILPYL
jgi:DNA-directed RNA polymerase subunit RPC12/RpoP